MPSSAWRRGEWIDAAGDACSSVMFEAFVGGMTEPRSLETETADLGAGDDGTRRPPGKAGSCRSGVPSVAGGDICVVAVGLIPLEVAGLLLFGTWSWAASASSSRRF